MNSFIKVSLSAYCVPVPVFWESQPWGHSHVNLSSQYTALIMCRWVERGPGEAPQGRPSRRVRTDVPGAGRDSPERSRPALSLHLPDTHPSEVTCAPAARCGEPGRLRPNPKWKAGQVCRQGPRGCRWAGRVSGEGRADWRRRKMLRAAGGLRTSRLAVATVLCSIQTRSAVAADPSTVFPRTSVATWPRWRPLLSRRSRWRAHHTVPDAWARDFPTSQGYC